MKVRRRQGGPTDVVLDGSELAAAVMAYLEARGVEIAGSSAVRVMHRGKVYGVGCFDVIVVVPPGGSVTEGSR